MPIKTTEQKIKELRPHVEKFVGKMQDDPAYRIFMTGIALLTKDGEPQGIIKIGNIGNKGNSYIRNVMGLSSRVAEIEMMGAPPKGFAFADIGAGHSGESAEKLADELATKVLTLAGEPQYASELISAAQHYLNSKDKDG